MRTSRNEIEGLQEIGSQNVVTVRALDLFCGAGGLTHGLEKAGIDVALGVDTDPHCAYPYTKNNNSKFLQKSVVDLSADEIRGAIEGAQYSLIAGCAPCQTFSTYQQGRYGPSDDRWNLLLEFGRIVTEVGPDLVTMENVPRLAEQEVFDTFTSVLRDEGYYVWYDVVNCADYEVPQQRHRLVLLASKLGPIRMIEPTTPEGSRLTVRDAIGKLARIKAGETTARDKMHQSSRLSDLNLKRIKASKPGGTWRDWPSELVAKCHQKPSGKTYPSVYARMVWDEPAPTMTTQYFGFGNGRFGHPEQDRAISLREGAILQSFPKNYEFVNKNAPLHIKTVGRLIGNAVPVNLGKAIGSSILEHIGRKKKKKKRAV
ncbi:DNA cytosine methyltransferase [Ruegeria arenilitoris]|uniref:DNA cytosine methyltransferase n=1 Tax=Ruegeria arenilitoris TaxID=1173585 RepID=UPI00147A370C|nr:DNA cytosine methyltransferase [Ruegeria arenilitoris]